LGKSMPMKTILLWRFSPGVHFGPRSRTHQLVDALEDHLAVGPLHVQDALVAQHLRSVNLHDGAEEILQLGGVEGAVGAEHEGLHVVVVVMVVRVLAVLAVHMVVVVVVAMVVPAMPMARAGDGRAARALRP
jgi:hypothetical protein